MDGMEQAKTVEDVRRAARKALSRLSRTFGEWETLIASLKADLSDQQSLTLQLRKDIKHLPTDEQVDFLNGKIKDLKSEAEQHDNDRKLANENRDNWKDECSRLHKDLQKKDKKISGLERAVKKADKSSGVDATAVESVTAQLDSEKTFSKEQAAQVDKLREDLASQRTERKALEKQLDQLQQQLDESEQQRIELGDNKADEQKLRGELDQAREQLEKQAAKNIASEDDKKELGKLRSELELARKQLNELAETERKLEKADKQACELQEKIGSLEFNNRALKNGTDLLRKEKARGRTEISDLKEKIEEMRVKVRMTEAHLAKARAGEESSGDDTLSMSAIQSRDIRFQVQNEELRVKLGQQRQVMDKLEEVLKNRTIRYKALKKGREAQQNLIEELQSDLDRHNKMRSEDRKADVHASQLKIELDQKNKMIEDLQQEILNKESAGTDNTGNLTVDDETQTLKLNATDMVASKDQLVKIAELKGQLAQKDLAMKAVQTSLSELRNRFQQLANKDRVDNTVSMPGQSSGGNDQGSKIVSKQPKKGEGGDGEVAATVQIRRPTFD